LDIKLKKPDNNRQRKLKPLKAFLCFFISVTVFLTLIGTVLFNLRDISQNEDLGWALKTAFAKDIRDTYFYKKSIVRIFNRLINVSSDESQEYVKTYLDAEGTNLIYFAENVTTKRVVTNSDINYAVTKNLKLPNGYNFGVIFDGEDIYAHKKDGEDTLDIQNVYNSNDYVRYFQPLNKYKEDFSNLSDFRIFMAVREEIIPSASGGSNLYEAKRDVTLIRFLFVGLLILLLLSMVMFVYYLLRREDKKEFDYRLSRFMGKVWIEVKVIVTILLMCCLSSYNIALSFVCFLLILWWGYALIMDLWYNRKAFFGTNIIGSIIKAYRKAEAKMPFQKGMLTRLYTIIGAEIATMGFGILFTLAGLMDGSGIVLFGLVLIAAGVYLLFRYIKVYKREVEDIGSIVLKIESIKKGETAKPLMLPADSDFYKAAQDINSIEEGITAAVEDKLKAEKMKIELITNVSHDLKTPLTSIIGYIDLLSKEENLPEHVKDYIKVLAIKSDKLKNLINDIFDLSKSSSGNMEFEREQIDLKVLVTQSLAEMEDEITNSNLKFKTNLPDKPVHIMGDGKKLSRVMQNLISNTLKYSLEGSRVHIILSQKGNYAELKIINIAGYEMDFNGSEVTERFIRGDTARSTEGHGLGLAIAQSYVTACGGEFNVDVEGDTFKVTIKFQVV